MKSLLPCPNCHQLLLPPIQGSRHARLRCPLCKHELTGGELLFNVSQQWMVIDDPGGEDIFRTFQGAASVPKTAVDQSLAGRASDPSAVESVSGPPQHQIESGEHPIDWEKFKPISHEEFQRKKRQTTSPLASLLQVVFGGLAAIPIALLLIWHLLGKDVGRAGPIVARYVPWVVPEKLRGSIEGNASDEDYRRSPNTPLSRNSQRQSGRPNNRDSSQPVDTTLQTPNDEVLAKMLQDFKTKKEPVDEFRESIDFLETMKDGLLANRNQDPSMKGVYAQQFYLAFVGLAEKISRLPLNDARLPAAHAQAVASCQEILRDASLVQLIRNGSRERWRIGALKDEGIVLIAEIKSTSDMGGQFECVIDSLDESNPKSITIRVPKTITPEPPTGSWLVAGMADWEAARIDASIMAKW